MLATSQIHQNVRAREIYHNSVKPDTICFLPCCLRKIASGRTLDLQTVWQDHHTEFGKLTAMRNQVKPMVNIDLNSPLTASIFLYKGSPYDCDKTFVDETLRYIRENRILLLIISAGYGIVDAREPIHNYNKQLVGDLAKCWQDIGLIELIADLLQNISARRVYGFFAGIRERSSGRSMYRYFFTKALLESIARGYKPEDAGCFYRREGMGTKPILRALGRTYLQMLNLDFDPKEISKYEHDGVFDGNILVSFDRFR